MFRFALLVTAAVAVVGFDEFPGGNISSAPFEKLSACDVAGRRMVWAHYVPWYLPGDASLLSHWFHSFPQDQVGDNPLREEIGRAMAMGIDGFFNDVIIHGNGGTSYWDLRPFLKAAEGTPFLFGL